MMIVNFLIWEPEISLFAFRLSLFAFRFSPFAFRLSLFAFRFSLFAFRLSLLIFLPHHLMPFVPVAAFMRKFAG